MNHQMLDKSTINEILKMKMEDMMVIYDYEKGLGFVSPALKGLFKESKNTKSLARIGALLIAIPDPITDVPGVLLLVMAKVIERNKGINIQEISREFNNTLNGLKDII
ncbi:MAG: hypothetical protein QXL00_06110 [Conexivisphaerales archaeon]